MITVWVVVVVVVGKGKINESYYGPFIHQILLGGLFMINLQNKKYGVHIIIFILLDEEMETQRSQVMCLRWNS